MINNPVRVLIVDDSIFMRQTLTKLLSCDSIEVIDVARNGLEAVEKCARLKPDIVTMDIEMPFMNGIDALKQIMKENPVPVIMLSTLTTESADATLEALANGAVDFITKKSSFMELETIREILTTKVYSIGSNTSLKIRMKNWNILGGREQFAKKPKSDIPAKVISDTGNAISGIRHRPRKIDLVAIGISTGGPNSLKELIENLPENFRTPIVIAQHMPENFTKSLANRLNTTTSLHVKEVEDNESISPATIYIAKGGQHLVVRRNNRLNITSMPQGALYKPSVDVLMSSVADSYHDRALGLIMTGMGHDGLEGIRQLRKTGAYIMAQEPESCVISGMPNSIIQAGLTDEIRPLNQLALRLNELCL